MLLLFEVLRLLEDLSDSPKRYSILHTLLYHSFSCSLIHFRFFVFVTLHSISLSGASLTIGKDGGVEPVHDLPDKS